MSRLKTVTDSKEPSYAQSVGQDEFNWWQGLTRAKELYDRGIRFQRHASSRTPLESEYRVLMLTMDDLAGNWPTCACGNQCATIPRNSGTFGEPLDEKLRQLGLDFCELVSQELWEEAIEMLKKIERRSAKILRAMDRESLR